MGFFRAEYSRPFREKNTSETAIFFIHGLFLNASVMYSIAGKLERKGFPGIFYDYPTRLRTVEEHGRELAEHLKVLPEKKIHIVTHSMGSLIFRSALEQCPELEQKIGRAVFLVPPSKGSAMASFFCRRLSFAKKIVVPLPDLSEDADSSVQRLSQIPGIDFGIIGARHDLKVSVRNTHLETERDHVLVNSTHVMMLFRKDTAELCENFLRNGRFDKK